MNAHNRRVDHLDGDGQDETNMSFDNTSHPGRPEPECYRCQPRFWPPTRPGRPGGLARPQGGGPRVRVRLLRELAATRQPLVPCHLSFPFGRVAVARDVFRWVPAYWDY